ncbi:hypothetical protein [Listeria ilorinensis]|uniref:hypothetical protein n=1 Tax=Listeria ilorinensis TaxID=2867439 RepID=UPI001EF69906|nr:hypothetical protein [Listeria ilorinensis]
MHKILAIIAFIAVFGLGYYVHYAITESKIVDELKPYKQQQKEDKQAIEGLNNEIITLQSKNKALEEKTSDKSSNDRLPDDILDTIDGFIKAEYNYTTSEDRSKNIFPYVTENLYSYFDNDATSGSDSTVKIKSELKKYEIEHYFQKDQECTVTVRAWTSFQVAENSSNNNQYLLDLKLEKDQVGQWLVSEQVINTINQQG